jgi:hypothetical protein
MISDPVEQILGELERPIEPRANFSVDLLQRLMGELGSAAAAPAKKRRSPMSRISHFLVVGLRRPRRTAAMLAAALLVVLVGNIAVAYYIPRYERALAGTPLLGDISRPFLTLIGGEERNATRVDDVSISSGHTVRLVAGYADGLRTVLFIEVDGKGLAGDPKAFGRQTGDYGVGFDGLSLTDQFGFRYVMDRPSGSGDYGPLEFPPLNLPASVAGARLTLHVANLVELWHETAELGHYVQVPGDWNLHVTLVQDPVHSLPLPSALKTSDAVYTFTSVQATRTEVIIHWTVSGAPNDELHRLLNLPGCPCPDDKQSMELMHGYFWPQLFDADGHLMQIHDFGTAFPEGKPAEGVITAYIPGPGRYRIQLGDALVTNDDERWILVQ